MKKINIWALSALLTITFVLSVQFVYAPVEALGFNGPTLEHPTDSSTVGKIPTGNKGGNKENGKENNKETKEDKKEKTDPKDGEYQISQPSLIINNKGKVDIANDKGKVNSKGTMVTEFINKYRYIIAGVSGVGAVSMILFFVLNFMRLGATSSSPQGRSSATMGLIFSGIAAAGLGAVTFIVGIFFNAL